MYIKTIGERKSGVEIVGASSCRFGVAKLIPHALHCTVNVLRRSLSPSKGETKRKAKHVVTHRKEEPHFEHATIPRKRILFLDSFSLDL